MLMDRRRKGRKGRKGVKKFAPRPQKDGAATCHLQSKQTLCDVCVICQTFYFR